MVTSLAVPRSRHVTTPLYPHITTFSTHPTPIVYDGLSCMLTIHLLCECKLYSRYSRGRVLLVPVFVRVVGSPSVLAVRRHLHRELRLVLAPLLTAIRRPAQHIVISLHYNAVSPDDAYTYGARGNTPSHNAHSPSRLALRPHPPPPLNTFAHCPHHYPGFT